MLKPQLSQRVSSVMQAHSSYSPCVVKENKNQKARIENITKIFWPIYFKLSKFKYSFEMSDNFHKSKRIDVLVRSFWHCFTNSPDSTSQKKTFFKFFPSNSSKYMRLISLSLFSRKKKLKKTFPRKSTNPVGIPPPPTKGRWFSFMPIDVKCFKQWQKQSFKATIYSLHLDFGPKITKKKKEVVGTSGENKSNDHVKFKCFWCKLFFDFIASKQTKKNRKCS